MSSEEPKFMKPVDLFLQRKRKNNCVSPQSRKKFIISPLKCIDLNSPVKDSQGSSLNENSGGSSGGGRRTPRKGTPSKRVLTPRKTPSKKTPLKDIKNENNPRGNCEKRSLRSGRTRKNLFKSPEKPQISKVTIHDENANMEPPTAIETNTELAGLSCLPIDWTLKTRMRLVSTKNFPYRGILTSTESASATTTAVRCLPTTISKESESSSFTDTTPHPSSKSDPSTSFDMSVSSELMKHCHAYIFPNLAGYEIFPRINNRCKVAPIREPMSGDLLIDYCESIKNLYDLLKARQCAYFYVCGHSFTALFRAAGVGGFDEIHAIITPTTEGFRDKLKEEGIEFTMPILEKEMELEKRRNEEIAALEKNFCDEQKGAENIINDVTDDDASNFLSTLGIDPTESQNQNFKRRKGLSKQVFKSTLVLVKGIQTQGLIPFLSNRLVILERTGSLARVPPTLVSHLLFVGGTLKCLRPEFNRFVEDSGETFNLEIKGPITPTMVINSCELFRTILGDFKLYLSNYEYATPLNNVRSEEKGNETKAIFAKANLKDCGLSEQIVESLCSEEKQTSQAYTTIFCEKGRYFLS